MGNGASCRVGVGMEGEALVVTSGDVEEDGTTMGVAVADGGAMDGSASSPPIETPKPNPSTFFSR